MKKKPSYKLQAILGIVGIIALILSFAQVSEFVAGLFGKTGSDKVNLGFHISSIAKTIFLTVVGLILVTSGIASLMFPIIGIPLIIVGLAMVLYGVWPLFKKQERDIYPNVVK